MKDLNYKILTIPRHIYRTCITLGHLETIGFPVPEMLGRQLRVYNGFDVNDYETHYDLIKALVDDGYSQWEEYLKEKEKEREAIFTFAIEWGNYKIFETIIEEDTPALFMQSDVFFWQMTYFDIQKRWRDLVDKVGYDNIKVAMLHFRKRDNLEMQEPIDYFWAKGILGSGEIANIVTPKGAEHMLNRGEPWLTFENYLPEHPETEGFYTAQVSQSHTRHLASLIQPKRNPELFENFPKAIEGIQL